MGLPHEEGEVVVRQFSHVDLDLFGRNELGPHTSRNYAGERVRGHLVGVHDRIVR